MHGEDQITGMTEDEERNFVRESIEMMEDHTGKPLLGMLADEATDTAHAIDFLQLARKTPDRPWFLYLAYNAPHYPLQCHKKDYEKYQDRYAGG